MNTIPSTTGVISIINSQKGQSNGIAPLNANKKIADSYLDLDEKLSGICPLTNGKIEPKYLPLDLQTYTFEHYWDIPMDSNESLSQYVQLILDEISVVPLYECASIYEWLTDGNPNSEYRFVNDLQHGIPLITLTKRQYYSGNLTGHILTITGALVIQKDPDNMLTCYVPQYNEPVKLHQYSIYYSHESQKYWQITCDY